MVTDEFTKYVIRLSVAQNCKRIGWSGISDSALEVLERLIQKYMITLAETSHNYAELFGQCEPTICHLQLAFKDMGISISELQDYVTNVDSCSVLDVPKYPVPRESHLNLLKPGSREVVTRPVHIHEHLPPMHPHLENEDYDIKHSPLSVDVTASDGVSPLSSPQNVFKRPDEPNSFDLRRNKMEEEVRPLREISSVMMTTSGFLSHAREGKLPEARTQPILDFEDDIDNAPPPEEEIEVTEPTFEPKVEKKKKHKHISSTIEEDRKSTSSNKDNDNETDDEFSSFMKEIARLKQFKSTMSKMPVPHSSKHKSHKHSSHRMKDHDHKSSKLKSPKGEKRALSPSLRDTYKEPNIIDTVLKLPSEPDRHKLNIFKKISKVKEEHEEIKESTPPSRSEIPHVLETPPKISKEIEKIVVSSTSQMEIDSAVSPGDTHMTFSDDLLLNQGTPRTPRTPDLPKFPEHKKKKKDKHKEKKEINETEKFHDFSPKSRYIDDNVGKPKTPEIMAKEEENHQLLNPYSTYPLTTASAGLIPPWNPSLIPYLYSSLPGVPPAPAIPSSSTSKDVPPIPLLIPPSITPSTPSPAPPSVLSPKESPIKTEEIIKKKLHKEEKKLKVKKKKDKKDKNKIKDKSEKKKLKLEKKQKEKLKKEKKEKKREKELLEKVDSPSSVPKITFKLGPEDSTNESGSRKIIIKQSDKKPSVGVKEDVRPEEILKPDPIPIQHISKSHKIGKISHKSEPKIKPFIPIPSITLPEVPPPIPIIPPLPVPSEPTPIKLDPEQNKIWICPACNHPDDGSPMIACDICDQWFHWLCVGILVAPESDWYCNTCIIKRDDASQEKKKKRKKKIN